MSHGDQFPQTEERIARNSQRRRCRARGYRRSDAVANLVSLGKCRSRSNFSRGSRRDAAGQARRSGGRIFTRHRHRSRLRGRLEQARHGAFHEQKTSPAPSPTAKKLWREIRITSAPHRGKGSAISRLASTARRRFAFAARWKSTPISMGYVTIWRWRKPKAGAADIFISRLFQSAFFHGGAALGFSAITAHALLSTHAVKPP